MADDVNIIVRVRDQTRAGIFAVNDNLNRLTRSAKDMDRSFGSLAGSALSLAPALIPIAASAAPIAVGLGAAGVAVAAFGAALGPQIAAMGEAAEAEKKYQEAVEEHGPASAEAAQAQAAYARQMAKLPPATREAAAQLSVLKDGYKDWSNALADDTMPVVTKGLATFSAIFPKLTPTVKGASRELDRFVTIAAGGVQSAAFDRFMQSFADFSTGVLQKANDGLIRLVRTMDTGEIGGNLKEFMDYAREQGPLVGDTLGNLGEALTKLLVAASDVGVGMLQVINAFASLVASIPTELLTTLLQVAIAFKAIKLAAAGFAAIGVGIQALTVQIIAMRTAAATAGGGMAGLAAAIAVMSRTAKIAVAGTGIGLLLLAVAELSQMGESTAPNVDKLTTSLGELGRTGKASGYAAAEFGKNFEKLKDQLNAVINPSVAESINNWGAEISNGWLKAGVATEEFTKSVDSIDTALANLVSGGKADLAKAALASMLASMNAEQAEKFRGSLDGYDDALANLAFEQKVAADAMGVFGQQAIEVQGKLDAQKQSAEGLRQSILALNDANRSAYDSQIQFEASIDALTESFKENGATLDLNTEAGRKNGHAMSSVAKAHDEMLANSLAAGDSLGSMTKKSDTLRASMMKLAVDAFDGNKKKAQEYVNTLLGTPESIATAVKLEREDAVQGLHTVQEEIRRTPGAKSIKVDTLNAAALKALEAVGIKTRRLPDGRTEVFTANGEALGNIGAVRRALDNINGKTSHTYVITHLQARQEGSHGTQLGYAHGGIIGAAGGGPRSRMTLVGEQGPELVNLAPGSTVRSNPDTRRMLAAAGGGDNRPIVIQLDIGGRRLGELLIDPLSGAIRARGGNVQAVIGQKGK